MKRITLIFAATVLALSPARAEYLSLSSANPRVVIGNPVDWTGKIFADGLTIRFGNVANRVPVIGSDGYLPLSLWPGGTTTQYWRGDKTWQTLNIAALSDAANVVQITRTLTAGGGLTGGGDLSTNRTFTLGTPSTLTVSSTNNVSGTTHLHAIESSSNPGAAASLLATDGSGNLTLVNLQANGSTFNLVNTTATTINFGAAATTLNIGSTASGIATMNNPTVALSGTLVRPAFAYNTDVGQLSKKFKAVHAAELWVETLVAQDTLATIGGRILVGPTTSLIADLLAAGTTIDVKHNNLANGDRIYMEANGKVEFMAVASGPTTITGGYRYTITRNLDGSGANDWFAGDAAFNTGTTGNGFIDLYSLRGVKSANAAGPTIVGNVRNSSTYNDWSTRWAIGNLKDHYDYTTNTYGAGFGRYGTAGYAWATIDDDPNKGLRMGFGSTVTGQWTPTGNVTIGAVTPGVRNIFIEHGENMQFRNYLTSLLTIGVGTVIVGQDGVGSNITIDTTNGLRIRDDTTTRLQLALDGSGFLATSAIAWNAAGDTTISGFSIGSDYIRDNVNSFGLASTVTGGDDVRFWAGSTFANRATAPFRVTEGGALTATSGAIGGWTLGTNLLSSTGINIISGASAALAFGATPPTSATAGTGLWLDRNGLYSLSGNTQNVTLTSAGITAGGGNVILDSSGLRLATSGSVYNSNSAVLWMSASDTVGQVFTAYFGGVSQTFLTARPKSTDTDWHSEVALQTKQPDGDIDGELVLLTNSALGKTYLRLNPSLTTLAGFTIGSFAAPTHMLDVYGTGWFQGDLTAAKQVRVGAGGANLDGDISVARVSTPTTGVIYLNSASNRYLYYDGTNYILSGASLVVNGTTYTSSRTVKKNIRDWKPDNTKARLRPRKYERIEAPGVEEISFVAEEVKESFPEAYREGGADANNPKAPRVPGIDPMAIITKHEAEIQALQDEIAALRGTKETGPTPAPDSTKKPTPKKKK